MSSDLKRSFLESDNAIGISIVENELSAERFALKGLAHFCDLRGDSFILNRHQEQSVFLAKVEEVVCESGLRRFYVWIGIFENEFLLHYINNNLGGIWSIKIAMHILVKIAILTSFRNLYPLNLPGKMSFRKRAP